MKSELTSRSETNSVAIIGLAGRFPGARDLTQFWENLCGGQESITFFPNQPAPKPAAPTAASPSQWVWARGLLEEVEMFDAGFFGFSAPEAELMDPQHRIFLELCHEALEVAGCDPDRFGGWAGVYAGCDPSTYEPSALRQAPRTPEEQFQILLLNGRDFLTTRVSYKLNLRGPSLDIQTGCSTSLVAVQVACQGLLSYQCDLALAGGVNVTIPQQSPYVFKEGGINSPDGHCRAFDKNALGTLPGNGGGVVVLKRFAEARHDRDTIYAVIRGAAINNDGSGKVSYTAPGVTGQEEAIATALAIADIPPEAVTYVEAHGTGTPLGDPVEVEALKRAFGHCQRKGFCGIGSVKSNLGHLSSAAGIAGLIKVVLSLRHKMLPPSLHCQTPNPALALEDSPFYVNTQLRPWETNGVPRCAGVSSFGLGGTNAHAVLEEAPDSELAEPSRPWQMLCLSAKTPSALEVMTTQMLECLEKQVFLDLPDVAYTLHLGRRVFEHRRVVVCRTRHEAAEALAMRHPERIETAVRDDRDSKVIFMFPGQGAQYPDMGRALYETERVFRECVDECARFLEPQLGLDLRTILFPEPGESNIAGERLAQTHLTQPALFVVEYALATLLRTWGIRPHAMIGHSAGEYVAACLAGVFSLEDALSLVALRGRLMQSTPGGAMLAVFLTEEELGPLLGADLSIATTAPGVCVVSGPKSAIESLRSRLAPSESESQYLHVSHAFHSSLMDPILESFAKALHDVEMKPPQIRFVSNLTGDWVTPDEVTRPLYWTEHLRRTVRLTDGLGLLLNEPNSVLLEIGPGQTLCGFAARHPSRRDHPLCLSTLEATANAAGRELEHFFFTLGRMWAHGVNIDWTGFYKDEKRRRVPLPTYPFERRRYWIDPDLPSQPEPNMPEGRKADLADGFYVTAWKRSTGPKALLENHPEPRPCLIFLDECGLGHAIVRQLRLEGQNVIQVRKGSRFDCRGHDEFAINPAVQADYLKLFEALGSVARLPGRIIHLWNATRPRVWANDASRLQASFELGFCSLIYVAQALEAQSVTQDLEMLVVTTELGEVIGGEPIDPLKSLALGPCQVIPREYPNVNCRCVDVEIPSRRPGPRAALAKALVAELRHRTPDRMIAYRAGRRWVRAIEAARLERTDGLPPELKEEGVYLITGGLGGIGLTLAEYLAQAVRAKLILTTRSEFPKPPQWAQWLLDHEAADATSRRIRALEKLESLGTEILVANADAADWAEMREVKRQALARFGKVNGIIHCAGGPGSGLVASQNAAKARRALAAKVEGTMILNALFNETGLDFFLLCSSLGSILSPLGQADECAANAFLDAFAGYNSSRNRVFTVSIGWDTWPCVRRAAQAAAPDPLPEVRQEGLLCGLSPSEGLEVFQRVLRSNLSEVMVSGRDLTRRVERIERSSNPPNVFSVPKVPSATPRHSRPALDMLYVPPRNDTEQAMTEIWQQVLGLDRIGIDDGFFALGGHSLQAIQLLSQVQNRFQERIPLSVFLLSPSVRALSARLGGRTVPWDWSPLVPIHAHGQGPPFFCVTPIMGTAFPYSDLGKRLGKQQRFFALQPRGLGPSGRPFFRIESLAEYYVKEMVAFEPSGPYLVGGWSFGAPVAYEMARLLQRQGRRVGAVVLIDSPAKIASQKVSFIRNGAFYANTVLRHLLPYVKQYYRITTSGSLEAEGWLGPSRTRGRFRKVKEFLWGAVPLIRVFVANSIADLRYRPGPYPGALTLLRTDTGPIRDPSDESWGWGELAAGGVQIFRIPGNHMTLLQAPHVDSVAEALRVCLKRSAWKSPVPDAELENRLPLGTNGWAT